jgi:4-amino-4-deoxy-L-arabinose transferase-like glycosyltransferase
VTLCTLPVPAIGLHGEAREGLVVRGLVESGDWVLPRRSGHLPSKPPLFHWVAGVAAHAFGISDVTVRLPSALAAIVMACVVFTLAVAIGGRAMGWLAVGALLGMVPFWFSASEARVDMVFAASVSVAIAGFYLCYRRQAEGGEPQPWARVLAYVGCACAVLAKGPAGLVLPALVVLGFLAWQGQLRVLRRLWSWPLACAVLVVDGGWYWLAYRDGGEAFLRTQLLYENVDRFVGRGPFARAERRHSVWRLEGSFLTQFFPWNLALLAAVHRRWRGRLDAADRLLHTWCAVILLVFTASAGHRGVYLLPLAPPIAILAARTLRRALEPGAPLSFVLRLGFPGRPLATLALVVAIADVAALLGSQALRHHYARRRSLAGFAAEVTRRVPADAPLYASLALPEPQFLVLAYRLQRRLERRRPGCGGGYVLVGEGEARRLAARGAAVLVSSGLARAPVGLVREPDPNRCAASS